MDQILQMLLSCDQLSLALCKSKYARPFRQAWWCLPAVPAPEKLGLEDYKFQASLGYTASSMPAWAI
jgi:hypothetical protein